MNGRAGGIARRGAALAAALVTAFSGASAPSLATLSFVATQAAEATRASVSAGGGEGMGIGLATCRRVVDAHGGTIGVTETSGGGATFWVELPG